MKIVIIGLGYVGLPLAHAFAKIYDVVGFNINIDRINELQKSYDRTLELSEVQLQEVKSTLSYSMDVDEIKDATVYIVTVPTPIDASNRPDLTPLIKSSESVAKVLKKGNIVIYESTVYPGVTEEVCIPVLEKMSGLVFNQDFFAGYSPERINPGDGGAVFTNNDALAEKIKSLRVHGQTKRYHHKYIGMVGEWTLFRQLY